MNPHLHFAQFLIIYTFQLISHLKLHSMSPPDNDNEDHSFPVISSPSLGNSRISDFDSSRTSPRSRQKFHKNSRLGTTHNTKTTSDLVQQQSITSQQSITKNMDGKKPDSDPALTRERVIEIALMKMSHRRRQNLAPEAFDHYGNLKPLWSYLQGDINKARKERSAQAREEHKAKVHEKWDPVGSPQLTEQQSKLVKLRMKMLPNTKAESVNPGTKSPTPTSRPQDTIALDTESSTSSPTFPNRQTVVLGETTRPHDASRPKKTPKTVELRSQAPPASPKQGSDVQFCTKCFHKIELPCTGQDKTPMQHSTNRTEIGEEWLDDDEIRSPLTQLFGRVMQYAARACNRRWPQPIQILEVLGIRDEGHDLSAVSNTPIVKVMRDMLDVQAGITVVEKIRSFQLESENSLWIKAILCFLVAKFIFKNGSPFDDPLILLNSRARRKFHNTVVWREQILADNLLKLAMVLELSQKCFNAIGSALCLRPHVHLISSPVSRIVEMSLCAILMR